MSDAFLAAYGGGDFESLLARAETRPADNDAPANPAEPSAASLRSMVLSMRQEREDEGTMARHLQEESMGSDTEESEHGGYEEQEQSSLQAEPELPPWRNASSASAPAPRTLLQPSPKATGLSAPAPAAAVPSAEDEEQQARERADAL